MTETLVGVSPSSSKEPAGVSSAPSEQELEVARELVRQARDRGVALTGSEGLLKAWTKHCLRFGADCF